MLQVVRRKPDVESSQGPFYDQTRARELLGAVQRTVFPSLWQHSQSPTRIWVVGCGAGEVVFSLAAIWADFLARAGASDRAFRIFGTDANAGAIAAAREGRYDQDIQDLISPAQRERFLAPTESGYRVLLGLREKCVFGEHDIVNDAVFSMMDLVVCCSPWLGLELDVQHRVGRGFRAALRAQRWLVLGSGQTDTLPGFDCLDAQYGVFQRTRGGASEAPASAALHLALLTRVDRIADELAATDRDLPGAILGDDLRVLRFRGRTGAYFEATPGALGFHVLDMARGEIHLPLREALDEARAHGRPAQRVAICRSELHQHSVEIDVVPFVVESLPFLLVRFREHWAGERQTGTRHRPLQTALAELEARTEELLVTREELDTVREKLDCASQEIAVLSAEMAGRSAAAERHSDDSRKQQERMYQHIALESALSDQRERRRIAGELHDRIGQSLALVQLKLKTMFWAARSAARATLGDAVRLIEETIVETRSLTFELSPPVLYDLGLKQALSWLADEFEARHGLEIVVIDDGQQTRLDDPVAGLLFRAVRELLLNVVKHADVSRAKVVLRNVDDDLELVVSDEGRGFAPPELNATVPGPGRGLGSVQEEINWLGGSLSIQAAPGRGADVQLRVPLAVATGRLRR